MQTFKKPLSAEEENRYLTLCRNGDMEARQILIEYNLRLVAHMVKKYARPDRDNDDLISTGTIGLIKAIDTFDNSKGSRLATYAGRCIDNELLMLLRQERKKNREVSIYEPLGTDREGNEINLLDILCSQNDNILDGIIIDSSLSSLPLYISKYLNDRERQIIILRYGLSGMPPCTQKQVAAQMNISRSYVSRIEKSALEKLKSAIDETG